MRTAAARRGGPPGAARRARGSWRAEGWVSSGGGAKSGGGSAHRLGTRGWSVVAVVGSRRLRSSARRLGADATGLAAVRGRPGAGCDTVRAAFGRRRTRVRFVLAHAGSSPGFAPLLGRGG